jgi:hypothetical protein
MFSTVIRNLEMIDKKRKIILLIVLVLGISAILGLVYYGRVLRESKERAKKRPAKEAQEQAATNPLGIEIPEQVKYYTGVIKEKSRDFLIINAKASDNFLTNDQELKARVNQATRLRKFKMSSIYLKPGQSPKDFEVKAVSLDDFEVGDRVTVYASENIKGMREFVASEIRAVEY